jgi:hypothetical protein
MKIGFLILIINLFSFFVYSTAFSTPEEYSKKINKSINSVDLKSINYICSKYNLDENEYKKFFPEKYFNDLSIPNFLLLTVPKTGTHLISKTIALMLGKPPSFELFSGYFYKKDSKQLEKPVNPHDKLNQWINNLIEKNRYPATHLNLSSKEICNFCIKNNFKIIFIKRDLRDQMISSIFYNEKLKKKTKIVSNLLVEEELKNTIKKKANTELKSYSEKTTNIENLGLVIKFENLVGPKGGGDLSLQKLEIMKIANYLNISLNEQQINYICKNLWGNTLTFRKGKIGDWKNYFSEEIKNLFIISGLADILIKEGYEEDYNW